GVGEHVHEHLIDLSRVAVDRREVAQAAMYRDPVAPPRLEKTQTHLDALVQVARLSGGFLEPREAAQVLHDGCRALGATSHHADKLVGLSEQPAHVRWRLLSCLAEALLKGR